MPAQDGSLSRSKARIPPKLSEKNKLKSIDFFFLV